MITEHKIRGGESTLKQFCVICIFFEELHVKLSPCLFKFSFNVCYKNKIANFDYALSD